MSGFKVNFNKTKLFGINVDEAFISSGAEFLICKIRVLPFKYLGLPIGANPRCVSTWQPIIDSLERRLAIWKGRHLSLGGRITLINSVLNSLPIFFLSFLRIPRKVLKILIRIQRNILWGGNCDKKKIMWVS